MRNRESIHEGPIRVCQNSTKLVVVLLYEADDRKFRKLLHPPFEDLPCYSLSRFHTTWLWPWLLAHMQPCRWQTQQ